MATTMAAPASGHPVTFDVQYPQELSRWLVFVKWLLAVPHLLILYALQGVASVLTFIAFFAILFTRSYPRELFNFVVGINRWTENVYAYVFLLRDDYPPFSWEPGRYAVTYDVAYPEQLSRWLIFVKWLLAFPHYIVLFLLFVGQGLALFVAFFAILFTKRFPEGLFRFVVGVDRYRVRVGAYVNLLRDDYPPFSTQA
jgi:hypothetical protein